MNISNAKRILHRNFFFLILYLSKNTRKLNMTLNSSIKNEKLFCYMMGITTII